MVPHAGLRKFGKGSSFHHTFAKHSKIKRLITTNDTVGGIPKPASSGSLLLSTSGHLADAEELASRVLRAQKGDSSER